MPSQSHGETAASWWGRDQIFIIIRNFNRISRKVKSWILGTITKESILTRTAPKNTTNDGSGGGKITGQKVSWLIKTSERFANQNQFMTFRVQVLTLDFYFTKIQEEELESSRWTQSSDEFNGRILRSSILWARGIVAEIMTFCFPSCLKPYH